LERKKTEGPFRHYVTRMGPVMLERSTLPVRVILLAVG
jgi:hypothetical protein